LWFDNQAEEAANFYTSIFKNSKITNIARYGEEAAKAADRTVGSVMTVEFVLDGQEFLGLNGGPIYKFNPAISLIVNCDTQVEIDEMWDKLVEGGMPIHCGWLQDKYGLSGQIVPAAISEMMKSTDTKKSDRMIGALLQMIKLDLKVLQDAYNND